MQALNTHWVLNALRHQRLIHVRSYQYSFRSPRVLNALRHQRLIHIFVSEILSEIVNVLNALRHQRLIHPAVLTEALTVVGAQRLTASEIDSLIYYI